MTMTSDRAPRASAPGAPILWTSVQKGLWVGKCNGEFAGMIERREERFVATGRFAQELGAFGSIADAKLAFAA